MVNKEYWIWLAGIKGMKSKSFFALLSYFKDPKHIFQCNWKDLKESSVISDPLVKNILDDRDAEKLDSYIKLMKEKEIKAYTIYEGEYPKLLKNIYDPPPVLYVKGNLYENEDMGIAVVGSRKASDYGLKSAERLSFDLAKSGIIVISGMALGIDTAAHRGALRGGGRTIAVFGCGLDQVYPRSGLALSREILKKGAIISEYPMGTMPIKPNFPARNRLISGMSSGVLVVEASEKSGSLITADFALEQGRDVFALPGNVMSLNSKGTNGLIKSGAKLIDCVEDILEEYTIRNTQKDLVAIEDRASISFANETERKVYESLRKSSKGLERIIASVEESPSEVISAVTMLELTSVIYQINGLYYIS